MTFTKEQLQHIIETDHVQCGDASALARMALAGIEAEPVAWLLSGGGAKNNVSFDSGNAYADPLREVTPLYTAPPAPVTINAEPVAWIWSHRKHPSEVTLVRPEDDERAEGAHWSGWNCQALYAAPPATESVPDYPEVLPCPVMLEPGLRFGKGVNTRTMLGALQRRAEYHAELEAMTTDERAEHDAGMKEFAAMLQGAEPVTTNDDGGRYEQDDYPECGWVVTHSGKDYFYREQKDAVMHMNSAVESGLGVSLRSFIPEPVSEHHKLNDIVIPDAYDIEAFGIFSATEGESGLLLQIEQFWFGTENCPQIGKENMVPKFALQAIIIRLQVHCNSMGEDTLIDIFASSAAPQQEVNNG